MIWAPLTGTSALHNPVLVVFRGAGGAACGRYSTSEMLDIDTEQASRAAPALSCVIARPTASPVRAPPLALPATVLTVDARPKRHPRQRVGSSPVDPPLSPSPAQTLQRRTRSLAREKPASFRSTRASPARVLLAFPATCSLRPSKKLAANVFLGPALK